MRYFWKKLQKTICGKTRPFWGDGMSGDKNKYNLFVGNEVSNIFCLTIFSKKNNIFQSKRKNNFWAGITFFEGSGSRMTKTKWNLFCGKLVTQCCSEVFFFRKTPYWPNGSRKTSFGGTFPPPILVVVWGRLFPNTIAPTVRISRKSVPNCDPHRAFLYINI